MDAGKEKFIYFRNALSESILSFLSFNEQVWNNSKVLLSAMKYFKVFQCDGGKASIYYHQRELAYVLLNFHNYFQLLIHFIVSKSYYRWRSPFVCYNLQIAGRLLSVESFFLVFEYIKGRSIEFSHLIGLKRYYILFYPWYMSATRIIGNQLIRKYKYYYYSLLCIFYRREWYYMPVIKYN